MTGFGQPKSIRSPEVVARPSREEIESLCLLFLVERGPCSVSELAERLGVSSDAGDAIERAVEPLVTAGRLELRGAQVLLTAAGREWRDRRLSELDGV